MTCLRLAFLLPALIAVVPAHAEPAPAAAAAETRPVARTHHHRLERMLHEFARRAEEQRAHATMLARR